MGAADHALVVADGGGVAQLQRVGDQRVADRDFGDRSGGGDRRGTEGLVLPVALEIGDLYIGDVGQGAREEINVSPGPSAGRGLNYGWRLMEGFLCFNPDTNCNQGGLTLPVLDYPHAEGACSVTGGYVYRGSAAPAQQGTYFYADFCNGFVRSFRFINGQATNQLEWPLLKQQGITSFGEDAQGELYLMTQAGSLFKIVPN